MINTKIKGNIKNRKELERIVQNNTVLHSYLFLGEDGIGKKVSGNTTGKITSQHELFYTHLVEDYGEEYAKKYLKANEQAIRNIQQIIDREKIECEFSTQKSYVYTTKQDEVIEIEKEVEII